MKKKYNSIMAALLGTVLAASSCSFLDVEPHVICSETFYASEAEVQYGLAGVYGVMNNEPFYGNNYSLMCSNIDDLCYFNRPTTKNPTQQYKHDATASEIYDTWTWIYSGINNANAFMEAVQNSEFDKKHSYYGEARFLRAYYHFILAQAWGDVPLRTKAVKTQAETMIAKTPQLEVLDWVAAEMEACLETAREDISVAPYRVVKTTMQGILARVHLFMAGVSVQTTPDQKIQHYKEAQKYADAVISSGLHQLNPNYDNVFINMISDTYEPKESMWEVDFKGDRSSPENWSNGRIGDQIGLMSTGGANFNTFNCNYSYAMYTGSLKLWDLYWTEDRTDDEKELTTITDKRQFWNMPPYNYAGSANYPPYGSGLTTGKCVKSIDKTPYAQDKKTTLTDELAAPGIRDCGKWRRETIYEGVMTSKNLYTTINFPILRYSDVLLMYAEATNEVEGLTQKAYDCVKQVRDRAGIKTRDMAEYDQESFRQLVRNERGRELCFEALRKYDLIRWGVFVKEMNNYAFWTADERWQSNAKAGYAKAIGTSVMPKHIYLPIPSIELGVNDLLKQNPNW